MSSQHVSALLLTPDFPPDTGGIQVLCDRIARHSRRVSFDVVAVAGRGAREHDRTLRGRVTRTPQPPGRQAARVALLNAGGLAAGLLHRPDAVLSAHVVTSPAAQALRRLTGAVVVQYGHGQEIDPRRRLVRRAMSGADRVVVVSEHSAALAEQAGARPDRIRRVAPGTDLPDAVAAWPREPLVVSVGRFVDRYKGFDTLVRAMPLVQARVPAARWTALGDGPLRPVIERLAAAHGLGDAASFPGLVGDEERSAWLSRAGVLAMPSRLATSGPGGEGFGIVAIEAGAHGLPVVAGRAGGALDAVEDGVTGLLVEPTDHVALADALAALLADGRLAQRMGSEGRRRALELAWPRVAQRVEDVVLEAIAAAQRR